MFILVPAGSGATPGKVGMQRGEDGDSLPKKNPNSLPKVPSPHFPRGPAWNTGWGWNVHMECAGISQQGEGRWERHWQRSHKNSTSPRRAELPGIPVDPRDNNVEQSFHPGRNVRGTSRCLGSDWAQGNAWKLKKINQWAEVRGRSILLTNHFNPRCKIPCWNIPCQVQHHCKELISFAAPKKKTIIPHLSITLQEKPPRVLGAGSWHCLQILNSPFPEAKLSKLLEKLLKNYKVKPPQQLSDSKAQKITFSFIQTWEVPSS